jgi:hypothetical protein
MFCGMATSASATTTVIGTEDSLTANSVNGFVGDLFNDNSPYIVASDGESPFDPFGFGSNTSDGLNFSNVVDVWNQAPGSVWTNIGFQTWVLPADLTPFGCGTENEPTCEPVGHFISPSDPWQPQAIGTWDILDANGSLSDQIITFNSDGNANLLFFSDPNLTTPLPAALPLFAAGLGGLGLLGWRRKRKAQAVA